MPVAKGTVPGMVLVHGPGALDRDEAIAMRTASFAISRKVWLSRGIAVLRYDKRTRIYGDKMGDMDFTLQR